MNVKEVIGDLYLSLVMLQQENAQLKQELAELKATDHEGAG